MENEILNRKSPEQNEGEASEKYLAAENQTPRSMARKLSNVKALIKANIPFTTRLPGEGCGEVGENGEKEERWRYHVQIKRPSFWKSSGF